MTGSRMLLTVLAFPAIALAQSPAPAAPPPPAGAAPDAAAPAGAPTAEEAKAFIERVNAELERLTAREQTGSWIAETHITDDTERNAAALRSDLLAFRAAVVHEALRYQGLALDERTARMIKLLRRIELAAPSDPARRAELTTLGAKLAGLYGKNKACEGKAGPCRGIDELEDYFRTERREDRLRAAWEGWHATARGSKPLYERFVALINEGARELGWADAGEQWRSSYDMPAAEFASEAQRLWSELAPFYEQLHCHVRARLAERYRGKVADRGPMPAHLLSNMWAQEWTNLYPMMEPYPGRAPLDVTGALKAQKWPPERMTRQAEAFFTSVGLDALPGTFWERSMFVRPPGREVICHASAWTVADPADVRIKMCIRPTEDDLLTIHHELGHIYYYHYFRDQPAIFRDDPNAGFNEAIGDAIALSVTPGYLQKAGLLRAVPADERALVNVQMKDALSRVSFLPWGLLVDLWRWKVFSGEVPPAKWNAEWWALRRRYQGVEPPSPRSDEDFDPGAKYHVPAHVSYMRYFLAFVYEFQFHRALCKAAGHTGPLHACSIAGSKEAGAKLAALLSAGASRPWPDVLQDLTGQRAPDATALLEYYAPLRKWLEEQNRGRTCGW